MNLQKKHIWVVIPAHNEAKHIKKVIQNVRHFTSNIIIIDDGSTDHTYQLAQPLTLHVLRHSLNLGKGAALTTGCMYAFNTLQAKAVIFFDADEQHSASHLPQFIEVLIQGHRIVFGVRTLDSSMPWNRRLGNQLLSHTVKWLFGDYIPDIPSGFKALTKDAYKKVSWQSSDYGVEVEIAVNTAKNNLDFALIPIHTIYHGYFRGMTVLESLQIIIKLISLKLNL
jgi:glycosyltransferase involved in cell wall biosynthesis